MNDVKTQVVTEKLLKIAMKIVDRKAFTDEMEIPSEDHFWQIRTCALQALVIYTLPPLWPHFAH